MRNPKKRMCKQLAAWRRWYLKMKKIWILCIQQNILAKFLRGKLAFKNTKILWPVAKKMPFLKAALDKKKKKKLNKTWMYSVTFSVFKLLAVLFLNKSLEECYMNYQCWVEVNVLLFYAKIFPVWYFSWGSTQIWNILKLKTIQIFLCQNISILGQKIEWRSSSCGPSKCI